MAILPVLTIGAILDHGGTVLTGSTLTKHNNIPIARVGDAVLCLQHGPQIIASGSLLIKDEGLPVAVEGLSFTSCGAILIPLEILWKSE